MKGISQAFALSCVTIICLAGLSEHVRATTHERLELAQASESFNQRVLEIALPLSATVRRTQGGSYTGRVTDFSSDELTISANGYSETVPISQIRQVEFNDEDIWIVTEGRRRSYERVRGYPVPLEGVPVVALEILGSSNLATLNLKNVLSDSAFERLSSVVDSDEIHAVTKILFESSEVMEVTLKIVRER